MTKRPAPLLMPSEVSSRVGFFDKFAGVAARLASRAPFFAFCLLLVVIWLVQGVVLIVSKGSLQGFLDSQYQLEINTPRRSSPSCWSRSCRTVKPEPIKRPNTS